MNLPKTRSVIRVMIIIIIASCCPVSFADPNIEQIVVNPTQVWLGDSINITIRCIDNSEQISRVFADITGPNILFPSFDFANLGDGIYQLALPGSYFDRRGDYKANITCKSVNSVNAIAQFSVFDVNAKTNESISFYSGDLPEIYVIAKKNDLPISNGISFDVRINGENANLRMPPVYDTLRGWIIRIASLGEGTYALEIDANYLGKTIELQSKLEIRPDVEFNIVSLSKTALVTKENINIGIKALHQGKVIFVNGSNVEFRINSEDIYVNSATQNGDITLFNVAMPTLSAGRYKLHAKLYFNGAYYYDDDESVDYLSAFNGKLTDSTGRPVKAQFRFYKQGVEKYRIDTLSDGSYSIGILPDIYDIEADFPSASIKMKNASAISFYDSLNYSYLENQKIEGLFTSGIFALGTKWKFQIVSVQLKYGNVFGDETNLYVFKCSDWNFKNNSCLSGWAKLKPDVESREKIASFTAGSLAAFAVGMEDSIQITMNFDKEKYSKKDIIGIKGTTFGRNSGIGGVSLDIGIPGTYVQQSIVSDARGQFSANFLGPDDEGSFNMIVKAEKTLYKPFENSYTLNVESTPSASLIFPGSVRVEKGKNTSAELSIVNIGQKELKNIIISSDLEPQYYSLGSYETDLGIKEEMKVPITFFSGSEDLTGTKSATIKVKTDELEEEKIFGLTIIEPQTTNNSITGAATSKDTQQGSQDISVLFYIFIGVLAIIFFIIAARHFKNGRGSDKYHQSSKNNNSYNLDSGNTSNNEVNYNISNFPSSNQNNSNINHKIPQYFENPLINNAYRGNNPNKPPINKKDKANPQKESNNFLGQVKNYMEGRNIPIKTIDNKSDGDR